MLNLLNQGGYGVPDGFSGVRQDRELYPVFKFKDTMCGLARPDSADWRCSSLHGLLVGEENKHHTRIRWPSSSRLYHLLLLEEIDTNLESGRKHFRRAGVAIAVWFYGAEVGYALHEIPVSEVMIE